MPLTAVMARARTALRIGLLLVVALLLGGCLLPPEPRTDAGRDVFNLYIIVLVLAAIVFVGVEGFIVYAIVRYRRRPGDDVLPEQHHGNTLVEIIWTALPTAIVVVLFVFSIITLGAVEARAERPGVTIGVEGFQWQWQFNYENGAQITGQGAEPPELAVPVGEPVRLVLTSRDVNHAFYVPDFLLKRDLIQFAQDDRANELEFVVNEPGTYAGQCAEFCGVAHADMVFAVTAMERADFDAYIGAIAAGETPPPVAEPSECEVTVEIKADDLQFDIDEFEVPAETEFCIEFENLEDQPHNVAIYEPEDEAYEEPLFAGEILDEPGTITYVVSGLEAGDYTFICDVHPQMMGTVVVTEQ